jgi:hypothetical protein
MAEVENSERAKNKHMSDTSGPVKKSQARQAIESDIQQSISSHDVASYVHEMAIELRGIT